MTDRVWFWLLLLVALTVPLLPDPFEHRTRLPLLHWLAREFEEVYTGER